MENIARLLFESRSRFSTELLKVEKSKNFFEEFLELLFPHFNFSDQCIQDQSSIANELERLRLDLKTLLKPLEKTLTTGAEGLVEEFFARVPEIFEKLLTDAEAIYEGDPAAKSLDEVIIAYPGFYAIAMHRVANLFYELHVPLLPRILAEYAHQKTGIDIHPGATIGEAFCIDHGTGIVIGETTLIGSNVKVYQGVTLGALSVDKSKAEKKRHPTIEDNVVIYSNATVLGGKTIVGKNSIIGGNVWLTDSVPESSMVYHKGSVERKSIK